MNTAVNPLSIRLAASRATAANPIYRSRMDRVGQAALQAMRAVAELRPHARLLELADSCEALQPALAQEIRAASRQGPMA